ncbi:MAG: DnaD domain protein [Lachnospiraceae bacterium]|nr:DnaD domain protein [Lachnospiraceae bacterium]
MLLLRSTFANGRKGMNATMTTGNISLAGGTGSTVLPNVFIDHFLKDANDAQIKVYLYLLRMLGDHRTTGITEIAEQFNHTENDVIRSLIYWEKKNLLSLTYDAKDTIIGIQVLSTMPMVREVPMTQETQMMPTVQMAQETQTEAPLPQITAAPVAQGEQEMPLSREAKDFPTGNSISKFSMDYAKEKSSYSLEDLQRLSENSEAKMLLVVAEQYFGRPLNPQEIRSLLFIYDRLAFSFDLEDYLIQFCMDRNQSGIHYIESVAISWYESGINTVKKAKEMARRYDKRYDKSAYSVMKFLGSSKEPTTFELDYIQKWTLVYHFSLAVIEEACKRTVMATERNRFAYADSILSSWHDKNVQTKEDISRLDKEYEAAKKATRQSAGKTSQTAKSSSGEFSNYARNDYDFAALEKALTAK